MSIFTLAISHFTISNLPWFIDLTVLVPMQYCSLQHRTLLPSPVTSTNGCCFCFVSISSLFLELFLHSSPVACWARTNLGSSSFSVVSFCLFIPFIHGHHLMVNTEIRLIIFFAAKDGEAVYTVSKNKTRSWLAEIMISLLLNSDLNGRK